MKLSDALKARHASAPVPESMVTKLATLAEATDKKRERRTIHRRRVLALAATSLLGIAVAAAGPHVPYALQLRAAAQATGKIKQVRILTEVYSAETRTWSRFGETYEADGHEFRTDGIYTHFTTPTQHWRGYPDWDLAVFEPNQHYGGVGTSAMARLAQTLEKTPWTVLMPFTRIDGSEDATTRTIRLEVKDIFPSPGAPVHRTVWVIEKKTNLVQITQQERRVGEEPWQPLSRQRFIYEDVQKPKHYPQNERLEAGRVLDLAQERAAWLDSHKAPLVEKDGVRVLELQRNQQGELFMVLDAGAGATRCDITAVRDSLGSVYPNQYDAPEILSELGRYFSPSTAMMGMTGKIEFWHGFTLDGRGLFGGWFIPLEPSAAPRTVTLRVRVMGLRNLTTELTLDLPKAACENVPDYMPLCSTFPFSPKEADRVRAAIRAAYRRSKNGVPASRNGRG